MDTLSYALSKKYTDEAVSGMGAIKGKNCTISSIENVDGGNRVTFSWTLDDGTIRTQTMDVMNGGVQDVSVERSETVNGVIITVTKTDGTVETATVLDAGDGSVKSVSWGDVKDKPYESVDDTVFSIEDGVLKISDDVVGDKNVIAAIFVNGVSVIPDENKSVNIELPDVYIVLTEDEYFAMTVEDKQKDVVYILSDARRTMFHDNVISPKELSENAVYELGFKMTALKNSVWDSIPENRSPDNIWAIDGGTALSSGYSYANITCKDHTLTGIGSNFRLFPGDTYERTSTNYVCNRYHTYSEFNTSTSSSNFTLGETNENGIVKITITKTAESIPDLEDSNDPPICTHFEYLGTEVNDSTIDVEGFTLGHENLGTTSTNSGKLYINFYVKADREWTASREDFNTYANNEWIVYDRNIVVYYKLAYPYLNEGTVTSKNVYVTRDVSIAHRDGGEFDFDTSLSEPLSVTGFIQGTYDHLCNIDNKLNKTATRIYPIPIFPVEQSSITVGCHLFGYSSISYGFEHQPINISTSSYESDTSEQLKQEIASRLNEFFRSNLRSIYLSIVDNNNFDNASTLSSMINSATMREILEELVEFNFRFNGSTYAPRACLRRIPELAVGEPNYSGLVHRFKLSWLGSTGEMYYTLATVTLEDISAYTINTVEVTDIEKDGLPTSNTPQIMVEAIENMDDLPTYISNNAQLIFETASDSFGYPDVLSLAKGKPSFDVEFLYHSDTTNGWNFGETVLKSVQFNRISLNYMKEDQWLPIPLYYDLAYRCTIPNEFGDAFVDVSYTYTKQDWTSESAEYNTSVKYIEYIQ